MDKIFTENKGLWFVIFLLIISLIFVIWEGFDKSKIRTIAGEEKCASIGMKVLNFERVDNWKERFVISCYKEGTDEIKRLRLFIE